MPGRDFTGWVLSELPSPPARVLEIGCGEGQLARAIYRAGYQILAVDPRAPHGRMFRRCKIEDLEVPGRFDAAVASLALHHVDELGRVLEKIHSLLKARGRFIVKEFAWDHMDRRTAAWIVLRRGALPRRIRRHYRTSSDRAFLTSWKRNLGDLHQYRTLRRALERRFQPVLFAWTPYLYEWPGGFTTKREERRLIEAGLINATGFRFVGRRR